MGKKKSKSTRRKNRRGRRGKRNDEASAALVKRSPSPPPAPLRLPNGRYQKKVVAEVSKEEFDAHAGVDDGRILHYDCTESEFNKRTTKAERLDTLKRTIMEGQETNRQRMQERESFLGTAIESAGKRRDGQTARMRLMRRQQRKFAEESRRTAEKTLYDIEIGEKLEAELDLKYDRTKLPYYEVTDGKEHSIYECEQYMKAGPSERLRLARNMNKHKQKIPEYQKDIVARIATFGTNAMRRRGDKLCDVVSVDAKNCRFYAYRAKDRSWYSLMVVIYENGTFDSKDNIKMTATEISKLSLEERTCIGNNVPVKMPNASNKVIWDLINCIISVNVARMFVQRTRDLETELCVRMCDQVSIDLSMKLDAFEDKVLESLGFAGALGKNGLGKNARIDRNDWWEMDGPLNASDANHSKLCKLVASYFEEIQHDLITKQITPVLRTMTKAQQKKDTESVSGAKPADV